IGRAEQADAGERLVLFDGGRGVHGFLPPILGSAPVRSRSMFSRCSHSTITAMAARISTRSPRPLAAAATGAATSALIPASEEMRVAASIASQTPAYAKPIGQPSAKQTPAVVATPLPPLNRSQTGKQ